MVDKKLPAKKLTTSNTKQEMLDAYNALQKGLEEKRESELRPEQKSEEKTARKAVEAADSVSTESVVKEITNLRFEIGKMLNQLSDKLEEEVHKYRSIKTAVEVKEMELQEIYELQKSASSLVALFEAHHQKRQELEEEIATRKTELAQETQSLRAEWEKEKKLHEALIRERDMAEQKKREREQEEYRYAFDRQQQLAKDKFEDEKAKLEREVQLKKEQMEKELAEKERQLTDRQAELDELRKRATAFPKEMEAAMAKAAKEAADRVLFDVKNKEELLKKEFAGERNVLTTRIAAFEQTVKEQSEQITKFTQQADKASQQVQEIALKALEGSSNSKLVTSLQQLVTEQARKQAAEK